MASGSTDRHRKRRLKSEAAQGGGSGDTTRMSAFDFVGIFLMWGIATGMVLLYLFGVKLYQIPTVAERIVRFRIKHLGYVVPEETHSDECGQNKNISINNENAMLREVLRQLGLLQHDIRQTQKLAVLTEEDRQGVKATGERAKANWTGDGSRAAIISSVAALNESSVSAKETHSHHTTASSMVAAALHIGHRTHTRHCPRGDSGTTFDVSMIWHQQGWVQRANSRVMHRVEHETRRSSVRPAPPLGIRAA